MTRGKLYIELRLIHRAPGDRIRIVFQILPRYTLCLIAVRRNVGIDRCLALVEYRLF